MKVVALIGQKGGSGKSTLAIGLAVAAIQGGFSAAVLDLDPQTNAANWKDRRGDDEPAVQSIQPGRLRQTLKAAEEAGAGFIFVDTPGKSDTAAVEAARVAQLVLIPVRPQIFDLETLGAVRDALRVAGTSAAFVVLNGVSPNATRSAVEQRQMIADAFGLAVAPVHLSQRAIYAEAPAVGKAPQEVETGGKAASELEALFGFIRKELQA